jgi:uncharacterized protein (TIGR00255 family)
MTGFARVRKTIAQGEMVLTVKTVNHRGLDIHFHLPPEIEPLESELRSLLKSGIARGHVQVQLSFNHTVAGGAATWNRSLLDAYMQAFEEASALYSLEAKPDLNSALRVPGVLAGGAEEEPGEEVKRAVLDLLVEAMQVLNVFREREGSALAAEMRQRGRNLCELAARIEEIRAGAIPAFHKRLREKLTELLQSSGLDPQRLAQEAAILADRSDIAEELIRLRTHACQLDDLLAGDGEVGKRIDFLLQEMNRESNTILSKTGGVGELGLTITDLALAAKSEIDKIREQSLNLE